MKKYLSVLFAGILAGGCFWDNSDTDLPLFGGEPAFTITQILAEGKLISALEVTDVNNFCYSSGNKLFVVSEGTETVVELASEILSVVRNTMDKSIWAGTYSSGLARIKNGNITYYDQQKNQLPRNLIRDVLCDPDGNVWFNCSAFKLGGLGLLSNDKIEIFTPANSALPDNLIKSTAIRNGKIYVATGGTVTQQKVAVMEEDGWKTLPVTGYYLMDMDVDQNGKVYVIDDTGLSSSMMTNKIYVFDQDGCRDILQQKNRFEESPYLVKTDLRNFLWVASFTQPGKEPLTVYDGNSWISAPDDFPDLYIKCISVDKDNNIWLGTDQGIYILDQ
ncbi:MAG TPA: two-component regulator propeller domain-containing protein [Prolixibacteraceae bacterium]|nr:two-component regulator propeller domain-containing protein [Prolixibacteraceae bacterium]